MLATRTRLAATTAALLVFPLALPAAAQTAAQETIETDHVRIEATRVVQGLEHPWGMALLPDGRIIVTERDSGRVRIATDAGDITGPLEGAPAIFRYEGDGDRSQAGLFDVKLDPDFSENGHVYLSYSRETERGAAVVVTRYRLDEAAGEPRLVEPQDVFVMKEEDQDSSGLHFGGRMAISEDGHLFLSIGERRNISRSQDDQDQAGSILRVRLDGSIPDDNPFVGEDGDDAIYAIGVRNPQGMAIHPGTGDLWINDHGPRGGDEINRVEAGANYGWPFQTSGVDYSGAPLGEGAEVEGMVPPVHVFEGTVAPSGMAFYEGELFEAWSGDMLNGGLASQALVRVRLDGESVVDEERIEIGRRVRDVVVAADGAIFLLTDHADGEIIRLAPADGEPVATGAIDEDEEEGEAETAQ